VVGGAVSGARDEILAAISAATADVDPAEPPAYLWTPPNPAPADLELLVERVRDYRAEIARVADLAAVPAAVEAVLTRHGATRIAIDPRLPAELRPGPPVELVADEPPLAAAELAALDGALTTAALAIAETGTLVLDGGPGQGRRALTLLPDLHVCVIEAEQVRGDVPEAIAALAANPTAPVTFISGASATSDIELDRVEGVHGPRRLEVLLVDPQ
jgi:L-lactate dehydrogenase complex protein LldG